jgi:hydrogenase maturation protease
MPKKALVLGIGNVLMGDEGFGVHAVETLLQRNDLPKEVEVLDGGTTGMELLPALEGLDQLIVIDAVRFGQSPGSLICVEGDQVPAIFKTKLSPHHVGLSDILAALAFKGSAPSSVVLVGIEPATFSCGMELSIEVKSRLDDAVRLVLLELAQKG